ncbi:MAG TPA: DUF4407 domain-containing protein [Pyrinomonadaceae bacterium]|jgi:hypothetical protein
MTNPVKKFFLFCSGASGTILRMKECEVEHNKYAGIGATIFFTAALAALSGGYALFTVFRDAKLAVAFGLFWGLIIFNLDRFIVSSIRKTRGAKKWSEIWKASPRFLLAVLISVVITRPLELKLFESEIRGQLTKGLTQERTRVDEDIKTEYSDITNLEQETGALRNRLVGLEDELTRRIMVASGEMKGWGGTTHPGPGPEWAKRQDEVKKAESDLNAFKAQYVPIIQANEQTIRERKVERDNKSKEAKKAIDDSPGLLKGLDALSTLTAEHASILWASRFIILLFISLETAPILVKLFSSRGPYDDHLDAIEHQVYASQRKKVSDINDEINTDVALSRQRNADRLRAETQLSQQLYAARIQAELQLSQNTMASLQTLAGQDLHDAEIEIARVAVARWREGQLDLLTRMTPAASYYGQHAPPFTHSPAHPSAPAAAQNIPSPPGPTATAGTPPPTAAPSNNGGSQTSAGAGQQSSAAATQPSAGGSPP